MDTIIEVCAGLDVHKETVTANVRYRDERGRRRTTARQVGTTTAELFALSAWLGDLGVTHVAMEATGVYWKPVVRHEALFDRGEMKGLPHRAVAAVR